MVPVSHSNQIVENPFYESSSCEVEPVSSPHDVAAATSYRTANVPIHNTQSFAQRMRSLLVPNTSLPIASQNAQQSIVQGTPSPQSSQTFRSFSASLTHRVTTEGSFKSFSGQEEAVFLAYETHDYWKSYTPLYKKYSVGLRRNHIMQLSISQWLASAVISVAVALLSVVVTGCVEVLNHYRYQMFVPLYRVAPGNIGMGFLVWMLFTLVSTLFTAISVSVIVLGQPQAGGSGLPAVICFLNGLVWDRVLTGKTLLFKLLSCIFANSSGLPVGAEAPMIHLGAITGALTRNFQIFRSPTITRDFATLGAACGVSAAFGAPIGGLLFVMEEISSHWDHHATWRIFFSTMLSSIVKAVVFNAILWAFGSEPLGGLTNRTSVLFEVRSISVGYSTLAPALLVGVFGGMISALFTAGNVQVNKIRRSYCTTSYRKMMEPIVLTAVYVTLCITLPFLLPCKDRASFPNGQSGNPSSSSANPLPHETPLDVTSLSNTTHVDSALATDAVQPLNATNPSSPDAAVSSSSWGIVERPPIIPFCSNPHLRYSPMATISLAPTTDAIRHLLSRNTEQYFDKTSLFLFLVLYATVACCVSGTPIASGLLVPCLAIGSTFGRLFGQTWSDSFLFYDDTWGVDPGLYALLGAGAFLGGVTRLTMASTVIMVELCADLHALFPMMISILTAKWVCDTFYRTSLYHELMEMDVVPFLPHKVSAVDHDCYTAASVMCSNLIVVPVVSTIRELQNALFHSHHAFPVVAPHSDTQKPFGNSSFATPTSFSCSRSFLGSISATDLRRVLRRGGVFDSWEDYNKDCAAFPDQGIDGVLVVHPSLTQDTQLDLSPIVNTSPWTVPSTQSLSMTYALFRSMGIRHLFVTEGSDVVGVITRKDLLTKIYTQKNTSRTVHSYINI